MGEKKYIILPGSGGGVNGLTSAVGGTALGDNLLVRGDGATGIQGSGITVGDTNDVSGLAVVNATRYDITNAMVVNGASFQLEPAIMISWSGTSSSPTAAKDVGIERSAAGLLEVFDGTTPGVWRDVKVRKHFVDQTITAGGTTGNRTIDKAAGTVNFAAAATTLTVTNNQVTTSSTIYCSVRTNDTTAIIKNVVPSAGSFVITLNAAATAETSVGFLVIN
jgi:hypothetical protein